ncbi:EF-hand [Conidiobolus coronatus NRRL 28638]|uniref:EF-hand n=1 Tax=Conidiobolus coronatus (strain ATCC 28846 / CBS 209.66 / NRRL 28638) TaxID=796925 RepID=A0A137PCP5_CONC2|nr:EF-hand [Conidiobolus coronatus NRRL 28638]|eukprot:KXN72774.1 EF-hand [Conidiobolus coronatus NRRL 28638]
MQLMSFFRMVDTDGSGQLSAIELQRALINGDWTPFSIETVCLLIDLFDRDFSGTLNFNEFRGVWGYLEQWRQLFFQFDSDKSGYLDQREVSQALRSFGFPVKDEFIHNLIRKFNRHASRITGRPITEHINFDTFIRCCVETKLSNDRFRALDPQNTGKITLSYDQVSLIVLNIYIELTHIFSLWILKQTNKMSHLSKLNLLLDILALYIYSYKELL